MISISSIWGLSTITMTSQIINKQPLSNREVPYAVIFIPENSFSYITKLKKKKSYLYITDENITYELFFHGNFIVSSFCEETVERNLQNLLNT